MSNERSDWKGVNRRPVWQVNWISATYSVNVWGHFTVGAILQSIEKVGFQKLTQFHNQHAVHSSLEQVEQVEQIEQVQMLGGLNKPADHR